LQSFLSFQNPMSGIPVSIRLQKEPLACPHCGSASRIGRSLCLSCLLAQGLRSRVPPPYSEETLEDVLGELHVQDADWRVGDYQILEEIGRGGIGVVYRSRHRRRVVALKRILPYHSSASIIRLHDWPWLKRLSSEHFASGHKRVKHTSHVLEIFIIAIWITTALWLN
jgi:serine/threonine protein kinase